ncbi:hypothetical protein M409DRAFT_20691 [Zasmidium cellare ATCC 36951]|uniref:Tat pathway signal sequence n=1 Tax=Zasmidium cellare ATCC 36951 TaxID=1080233 RepID=A0A6A6CQA8_ZASCE|nr:uncharacterized protein M409DRAFT_20691 [Zasmidium cellare ATCC 36951]KAF2169477.1 hypothetical protein M409DRAFT_20691 [Zasmidium cellare ATCC 36951]
MKYAWNHGTYNRLESDLPTHGSAIVRTKSTRLRIAGSLIITGLIAGLGIWAYSKARQEQNEQSPTSKFSRIQVATEVRSFTPSAVYLDGQPWTADMPKGGGYVTTQGRVEPDANGTYVVSMWHQIHCLQYINHALFPGGKIACREVDDVEQSLHLRHCIEYISKAILCAADTTLEKATVTPLNDGRHNYFVGEESAWETPHKCRSLEPINSLVEEYSVSKYAQNGDK